MGWINVNRSLPKSSKCVAVKVDDEYAIATYDADFGFTADWSGYNIDVDDDSGLNVNFDGKITHWMPLF